jgi:hypothetical protein
MSALVASGQGSETAFHHRDTENGNGRIKSHSRRPRMRFGSSLRELWVSVVIAVVVLSSLNVTALAA